MNDLNPSNNLADQLVALQRQVFTLLLALIVVSGTLAAYMGYESHCLSSDIAMVNTQVVQPYKQKMPAIETLLNQLYAYGQTHPDFRPILKKYGINQMPAPTKK